MPHAPRVGTVSDYRPRGYGHDYLDNRRRHVAQRAIAILVSPDGRAQYEGVRPRRCERMADHSARQLGTGRDLGVHGVISLCIGMEDCMRYTGLGAAIDANPRWLDLLTALF